MKLKEASSMAHEISEAYQESGNVMELSDLITEISAASDTYIRVETGNGKTLLVPLYAGFSQQYLYSMQATNLRYKLKGFNLQSISEIVPGTDNMRMLIYATYLNRATDSDDDKLNDINSTILYMFTPLYPVQSTVAIACPFKLMPTAFSNAMEQRDADRLKKLKIMSCIKCGRVADRKSVV